MRKYMRNTYLCPQKQFIMRIILFFCSLIFLQFLPAQPQILSSKVLQSDSIAAFNRVIPAEKGDFYVGGYVTSPEKTHTNAYFAKMNEKGAVLWEKNIDKKCSSRLLDFAVTKNKEFLIVLYTICGEGEQRKYVSYLQKWDSLGNILTETPINEEVTLISPIKILPSNEYLIGIQQSENINDSTTKTLKGLAKFSENGSLLWQKTYKAAQEKQAFYESSFLVLPNHNIVFIAANDLIASEINWAKFWENTQNISLIYCSDMGEEIERKEINTPLRINHFAPTTDGNFLVLGTLYNKEEEIRDMYIGKISAENSHFIWEKNLLFAKRNTPYYAFEMPENHYLISGTCASAWSNHLEYTTLTELNNTGEILWTKVFKEGNFMIDAFQQKDGTYQCVGLCSEQFKAQKEDDYWQKKPKTYNANLLSLSQNACLWEKNLFLPGQEQAYCIEKAQNGGYFLAGIDFAGNGIFLLKIAENGELLWRQSLETWTASVEVPVCLQAMTDGGCMAINNNGTLFCVSENGIIQWKSDAYHYKNIAAIISADKENYFIAGATWEKYPDKALWIAKINATGKSIWEKKYDLAQPIEVWSIDNTAEGGFILTGESGEIGATQAALMKIGGDGKLLWEKNFPLGKSAHPKAVLLLKNGGYAIAGISFSPENKDRAFLLITDEKGNLTHTFDLVKSDNEVGAAAITTDNEGNILLAATHEYSNYKGEQEIYVTKIDLKGQQLWEKMIGGGNSHYVGGIALSPDNQIIVTGYSNHLNHTDKSNVYIAKVKNALH